jgi:hypothetical protein
MIKYLIGFFVGVAIGYAYPYVRAFLVDWPPKMIWQKIMHFDWGFHWNLANRNAWTLERLRRIIRKEMPYCCDDYQGDMWELQIGWNRFLTFGFRCKNCGKTKPFEKVHRTHRLNMPKLLVAHHD